MVMALSSRRSCTTTRIVLSCAVLNSVEPLQHQFVVNVQISCLPWARLSCLLLYGCHTMAFSNKTASILLFSQTLKLKLRTLLTNFLDFLQKKIKKKEPNKNPHVAAGEKINPPKSPKEIPDVQTAWLSNCAPSHWAFWAPSAFTNTQLHPSLCFGELDSPNSKLNSQKKTESWVFGGGNFFCPKNLFEIVLFVLVFVTFLLKSQLFLVIDSDPKNLFCSFCLL